MTTKQKQDWILLVESKKDAAGELRAMLLQLGFQVLVCHECSRAHWYLQNQKFACVVIDHEVNGANGVAVVSAIKKNTRHLNQKTPFILMSGALEAGFLNRVVDRIAGALRKPGAGEVRSI